MTENVRVDCIRKRDRHNPHERIEGLGGIHNGKRWYLPEEAIIAELLKITRQWHFYVSVNQRTVWVIVATHEGRRYLKTQADGYEPNNLLDLPQCP